MQSDPLREPCRIMPEPKRPSWRDMTAIAEIQCASFRKDLAYKRWMLFFFWLFPGVTFLAMRDDSVVTGCIIADRHRGAIRIMNIAVHPAYRQRGIGRALLQAVLREKVDTSVVLMVQEHNRAARQLYESLGFVRTAYHASYYGTGYPGIEMTLRRS